MGGSAKYILVLALVAIVLLGVAGSIFYFSKPPTLPPAPHMGERTKIRIANIGLFSVLNLVAEHEGYFTDNGLDARITEYDSGATSMAALISGESDFAIAADFVGVTNLFANEDIRVLARVSGHDVFRLIARRDKQIARPQDLKGKRIGVTRQTAGEFYLGRFLTANNLQTTDVTLVDLSPSEMIDQIEEGQLDAILIFEPEAYAAQTALGDAAIVWSAQGDQRAYGLVYAMRSFVEAHPDVVERYLLAIIEAEDYVRTHDAETREFLVDSMHYDAQYLVHIWPEFTFSAGLDQDVVLSMEEQARWIIRNGLTQQTSVPNYLEAIYFDALERVKPSSVEIVH